MLSSYSVKLLRLLARKKKIINYAKYNHQELIKILEPLVDKHDLPINNKSRFDNKRVQLNAPEKA
jgi:hypothetical protein